MSLSTPLSGNQCCKHPLSPTVSVLAEPLGGATAVPNSSARLPTIPPPGENLPADRHPGTPRFGPPPDLVGLSNLLELALASLLLLSSPERVEGHVVFIHGVRFSNRSTPWFSSGRSPTLWPPWLTDDIPGLAVWSIQHDSAPSLWRGHAMSLVDRANNLFPLLLAESRLAQGDISFVAHSFGGLILQQILRVARDRSAAEPNVAAFLRRVTRIAFLGTPHHGATLATWTRILRLLVRPSSAVKALTRNDPNLRGLNQWFRRYVLDTGTSVQTFVETKNTFLIKVVASDSADPGLPLYPTPLDANHFDIAAPESRASETYVHLKDFLTEARTPQE